MSEEKSGAGRDPEMSKPTAIREDPEKHKPTMVTEDREMDIPTQLREAPEAGHDPGSIEFELESMSPENEAGPGRRPAPASASTIGANSTGRRYELRDELGSGGMGIVTAAWDGQLQRSVAVKRLRRELATSPRAVERFFDEALVMAGLDHPGVVPIFEKGTLSNGEVFYSMKKVGGKTLEDMIARRSPDDIASHEEIAKYVDIFERICQTMAACHKAGVVHRDLKPTNVMVDDFGSVLVMDWGLAKRIDESSGASDSKRTVAGALIGTPCYMSPEQATGQAHKSDCRSDVFSLGVILYEILTGVNPFDRDTIKESLDLVVSFEPQSPRDYNPAVDRDLAAICLKAMSKDRAGRYATARDLADDIRRYREFRPVSARSPGLGDRVARWWRRNPRMGGAAAAAVLMVLVVGASVINQRLVESRMVDRGFGEIEKARERIERIDQERATLVRGLESPSLPDGERASIETRLGELDILEEFEHDKEEAMAMAIAGFTILQPDREAQSLIRERTMGKIDAALARGEWLYARIRIENALEQANADNILGWSPEELGRLGEKLAEAKRGEGGAGPTNR